MALIEPTPPPTPSPIQTHTIVDTDNNSEITAQPPPSIPPSPTSPAPILFRCVYRGPQTTYKASKLADSSTYVFRIAAANDDAGQGRWSGEYRFTTTKSPPLITRPPIVTEITNNSCLVEWQAPVNKQRTQIDEASLVDFDALEYCLQIQSRKDSDYREVIN